MSMSKVFQDILSSDGTLFYFLAVKNTKFLVLVSSYQSCREISTTLSELSVALKEG